jgi:NADH-quinone oxidoreductase subunit G
MPVAELSELNRVFIIGSFLRKDHPLLAARLRAATKDGAKISLLHATDDDLLMPLANKIIAAPSEWLAMLNQVIAAIAAEKAIPAPAGFAAISVSEAAKLAASSLLSGERKAVFLGNAAAQHPQASQLHIAAQWIAEQTGAKFGYLTEAANTIGGYLANAIPGIGTHGANAGKLLSETRKAYLLLNAEPELDSANPQAAQAALAQAEMVVVMSPYKHGLDYADVLLPIAPFTETSGTFVNAEGRAQSFNGTVKPMGEARPAWKVLRVLGNLLDLPNFEYETSEAIRTEVIGELADTETLLARLNNVLANAEAPAMAATAADAGNAERVADVPIYFTDAIVRRSPSLQMTSDGAAPRAWLSAALSSKLGVVAGDRVKVSQGKGSALLTAAIDKNLPATVVRVAAGHNSTAALGAMFGAIAVEKA